MITIEELDDDCETILDSAEFATTDSIDAVLSDLRTRLLSLMVAGNLDIVITIGPAFVEDNNPPPDTDNTF